MTFLVIKYTAISFGAFYIFCQIQNITIKYKRNILGTVISVVIGILSIMLKNILAPLHIIFMISVSFLIYSTLYKLNKQRSFTTSVFSFGFSYAIYIVSCFLGALITIPTKNIFPELSESDYLQSLLIATLQIILIVLLFKINYRLILIILQMQIFWKEIIISKEAYV